MREGNKHKQWKANGVAFRRISKVVMGVRINGRALGGSVRGIAHDGRFIRALQANSPSGVPLHFKFFPGGVFQEDFVVYGKRGGVLDLQAGLRLFCGGEVLAGGSTIGGLLYSIIGDGDSALVFVVAVVVVLLRIALFFNYGSLSRRFRYQVILSSVASFLKFSRGLFRFLILVFRPRVRDLKDASLRVGLLYIVPRGERCCYVTGNQEFRNVASIVVHHYTRVPLLRRVCINYEGHLSHVVVDRLAACLYFSGNQDAGRRRR